MVFDRLWYPLLITAIGPKLIGPHNGIHVNKQKVCKVGSVDSPYIVIERSDSRQVNSISASKSILYIIHIPHYLVISQTSRVKPLNYSILSDNTYSYFIGLLKMIYIICLYNLSDFHYFIIICNTNIKNIISK